MNRPPQPPKYSARNLEARRNLIAVLGHFVTNEDIKGMMYMLDSPEFNVAIRKWIAVEDEEKSKKS